MYRQRNVASEIAKERQFVRRRRRLCIPVAVSVRVLFVCLFVTGGVVMIVCIQAMVHLLNYLLTYTVLTQPSIPLG